MKFDMKVVSVQIAPEATALDVGGPRESDIVKLPVSEAYFAREGVVGDTIVGTKHHGGPDQAVYAYSAEDYEWWERELGEELVPGQFGENLTLSSFGSDDLRIGDRYEVGQSLIEVTAPRVPCGKFAARMGRADWVETFRAGRKPGFYARVLEEGRVRSGDRVVRVAADSRNLRLMDLFDLFYDTKPPVAEIRRALASPIAERARTDYERRLAKLGQ